MRRWLAPVLVAIAIAACERVVDLTPGGSSIADAAHFTPDTPDPVPDAAVFDASLDSLGDAPPPDS